MKFNNTVTAIVAASLFTTTTAIAGWSDSQMAIDSQNVLKQQAQYSKVQPIPFYNWSIERDMLIQLYNIRNLKAATHIVWRGDTSVVEGDCPAIGYGIPYDTSLTNPYMATDEDYEGRDKAALTSISQPEPNGVFASTNTAATWVMCVGDGGVIEPIYTESKVTGYPYPVRVDYKTNRVVKSGKAAITIRIKR